MPGIGALDGSLASVHDRLDELDGQLATVTEWIDELEYDAPPDAAPTFVAGDLAVAGTTTTASATCGRGYRCWS